MQSRTNRGIGGRDAIVAARSAIEPYLDFLKGGKEFADFGFGVFVVLIDGELEGFCLLYTSDAADE